MMGLMMETEFECEMCHNVFVKDCSDEEAAAEALEKFGVEDAVNDSDMAKVCDDCYKQLAEYWGWDDVRH
jgi:nitrate/TMAO reductase-like tetraheme cytochrome c subunit